ncbi:MAG: hypothetical protein HY319_02355 [Armatimonadetes bacterium]|nr:hypothetical protein [Armatimonadota bacterium]
MARNLAVLVLVLVACAIWMSRVQPDSHALDGLPQPRKALALVDLHTPGADPGLAPWGAEKIQDYTGLAAEVLAPVPLPQDAWDAARGQYDAYRLLERLPPKPNTVVIGLTSMDTWTSDIPEWRYCYGAHDGDRAVVSLARTGVGPRGVKMTLRYVLEKVYELPCKDDPKSLLHTTILGPDDLDRMEFRI